MKRSFSLSQFLGFAVTSMGGTLLHYLYDWTGQSRWAALVSGVNESTWEHMKLLFFPLFSFAIIQYFFFRENDSFWCIKLRGTLLGLALIPILFYTYNGAIGKSPDWLNIAIFFISAAIVYIWETRAYFRDTIYCKSSLPSFLLLCLIALAFVWFTFSPPTLPLFRDPLTGTYGIA